nr:hypothetical protein [Microctonus hyperodae filamentous virus]
MKEIENSCKYSCNLPDIIPFTNAIMCKPYQKKLGQMGYVRWVNTFYRGGHSFQHQTGYAKCNRCEPNLFQLAWEATLVKPKIKRMNIYPKQIYSPEVEK